MEPALVYHSNNHLLYSNNYKCSIFFEKPNDLTGHLLDSSYVAAPARAAAGKAKFK